MCVLCVFVLFSKSRITPFSTHGWLLPRPCSVMRDAMLTVGTRFSRTELLSLYRPVVPGYDLQQRLRELGLWTVCHLSTTRHRGTVCLRRYHGCRADHQRRVVPTLTPTGNGAFTVAIVVRSKRRSTSPRPRTLVDVRRSEPASDARVVSLSFGFIDICSLAGRCL